MELTTNFLSNVAGMESIKKELKLIRDWFVNRKRYEATNINVPKGILACGPQGTGKTYVLKEYAKSFNIPIIEIDGSAFSRNDSIDEAFERAREMDEAIIFIDELGLLIDKNPRVARTLQMNMDGFKERGNTIVLATVNGLFDIPEPLLRRGRFDRVIRFEYPSKKDTEAILQYHIDKMGLISCIDYDFIMDYVACLSCSDIVAIVNDAYLRSDNQIITTDTLEQSYNIVVLEQYNETEIEDEQQRYHCAVHEASHCVMLNKYSNYFKIYRAGIMKNGFSGGTVRSSTPDYETEASIIAHIDVSIAGAIGTKIIIGETDLGCSHDLNMAYNALRQLVNDCGHGGIQNVLPEFHFHKRNETEYLRRKNELKIKRILKKRVRFVTHYLKKNKNVIIRIAAELKAKGTLNRKEIMDLI